MNMNNIIAKLEKIKIVPVVAIERADLSLALADTLIEAGLPCAKITFRMKDAATAMKIISQDRK